MNYRHGFHAANHADVLKHVALALLLAYQTAKPKPLFVLDSHAGRGLYDLGSEAALRSGEFRLGAMRLLAEPDRLTAFTPPPSGLAPYLAALGAVNPDGGLTRYPGSPLIVAQAMRPGDRLVACELHPEEAEALKATLRPFRRARVEMRDGYQALKSLLPPPERRGLILIDPPFEKTTEFEDLAAALKGAVRRFADGVYLVWYPLKDRAAADRFLAAVRGASLPDATIYELFVRPPGAAPGLAGSGLLALNASYALDAPLRAVLPYLAQVLAQGPGALWRAARLTPE